jgi:hypothetical protein
MFWEGLKEIRFQQNDSIVTATLKKNINLIQAQANKYGYKKKLTVWTDSLSSENWFSSNSIQPYPKTGSYKLGMNPKATRYYMFGLKKVFVGSKDSTGKEELICFTFYVGDNPVKANIKSKYASSVEINGLIHFGINYRKFKVKYLYHVLEEVGYGRSCYTYHYNCMDEDKFAERGDVITTDKDVLINWSKYGDLFSVTYHLDFDSYRNALGKNIRDWRISNSLKYPSLD